MKKYLTALLAPLLLGGCYSPHLFPLQPGEKIIFNSRERAAQYRQLSGNDRYHTNSCGPNHPPLRLLRRISAHLCTAADASKL